MPFSLSFTPSLVSLPPRAAGNLGPLLAAQDAPKGGRMGSQGVRG